MNFDPVKIMDADIQDKVALTHQVAGYLQRSEDQEKRATIENVARALAQDVAAEVRKSLAFELRNCPCIPHDLAARIASDIESVSGPFLAVTTVFSDRQFAGLIPHLEEHAHVTIAKREDLGEVTCDAVVTFGSEKSVSFLVRNKKAPLRESTLSNIIKRFPDRQELMNQTSVRSELPISIVKALMDKVSQQYRSLLEGQYGLSSDVVEVVLTSSLSKATWDVIANASEKQIHAYVKDLREQNRLTMDLIMDMLEKGCVAFLESALAFRAGLTLVKAREMLHAGDIPVFVALMQNAKIDKASAQMILETLKQQNIR